MILPGQTIHEPLLFRSPIPGYFTEAWLLVTVPLLVGGAKIRFTLKGVARGKADYSKQCAEIEVGIALVTYILSPKIHSL